MESFSLWYSREGKGERRVDSESVMQIKNLKAKFYERGDEGRAIRAHAIPASSLRRYSQ